jgi:hypothetical protein
MGANTHIGIQGAWVERVLAAIARPHRAKGQSSGRAEEEGGGGGGGFILLFQV